MLLSYCRRRRCAPATRVVRHDNAPNNAAVSVIDTRMSDPLRVDVRHHTSLSEIAEADWNALYRGNSEDWRYFRACEDARSQHFIFSALAAYRGTTLIAAVPVFKLDFRLDLVLGDRMRWLTSRVLAVAPRLVKVPILGMGHPMTEECPLGFHEQLTAAERGAVLIEMVQALERVAKDEGIKIVIMKDVTSADTAAYGQAIDGAGYARIESLPIAEMDVPFASRDDYIATLPSKRRTQMRKKLRQAGNIETQFVDSIDGIESEIKALYEETRSRRARDYEAFDEVPDDYFNKVIGARNGHVKVMLSRIDGALAGFMFLLVEADRVIFKFVGMHYPLALDRSLYFHKWMELVDYCIANRIRVLQAGQTNYITKVRMGCDLRRSWVYFKYRGRVIGPLARKFGSKISLAAEEPDLIELGDHARYQNDAQPVP